MTTALPKPIILFFLAALVVWGGWMALSIAPTPHVIEKHDSDALDALRCIENRQNIPGAFMKESHGIKRVGFLCVDPETTFLYVVVIAVVAGAIKLVTAFRKEDMDGSPERGKHYMKSARFTSGGRNIRSEDH